MAKTESPQKSTDPNLQTICRLCLEYDAGTIDIFKTQLSIPVRIMACAAVEIRSDDGLPHLICSKCRYQLEVAYFFRKKCQISNRKLRKHIRLLNLGRKSRIFSNDNDEDDPDEDEQQIEEARQFIESEETRQKVEQEEKNKKLLEEQREKFRREDTQRLFEEFGTFMQLRTPLATIASVKKEIVNAPLPQNSVSMKKEQVQEIQRNLAKSANAPKLTNRQKQQKQEISQSIEVVQVEAENEITSSDQIPDDGGDNEHDDEEQNVHQEQEVFGNYVDDVGNDENSTMLIFDENEDEEHQDNEIIQIDNEGEEDEQELVGTMCDQDVVDDEEVEEGIVEDTIDEAELENKDNDNEEMDEFIFLTDLEGNEHCVDQSDRVNDVESYQIQFLKEERTHNVSADSNALDQNGGSEFIIEDVKILNRFGDEVPKKLENHKKLKKKITPQREEAIQLMESRISTDDLKIFKCSDCPQSFTRAHSLLRHRSAHKEGREYCCDYCDKFFSCKSSLDRHIRIHTGEKPFTCEQCGKNFMQKEVLKRHLTIHTGQRPYQCPHCPRSFVQKLLMKQHINAMHKVVPEIVKSVCHLCPKTFLHPSGLSRHLLTHKGMVFSCSECGRTFNDKSSLRRHFAVHSKSGPKREPKPQSGANESSNEYL